MNVRGVLVIRRRARRTDEGGTIREGSGWRLATTTALTATAAAPPRGGGGG